MLRPRGQSGLGAKILASASALASNIWPRVEAMASVCITRTRSQRWSPRGHGLGLEAPRGQLVMSLALALALGAKSLALALASENQWRF